MGKSKGMTLENSGEPGVHAIIKSVVSTASKLLKKEHLMNIGEVLSRSWKITWKYKVLWIFGILAGCASGGGSGGGGNGLSYTFEQGDLPPWLNSAQGFHLNIPAWEISLIVIMAILFVLLLIALFIFLGTIGKVGLIRGTQQ